MSKESPSDLIERAEKLAGCRVDDPDNPAALFAVFGALGRALGTNPFKPQDDIAAGVVLWNTTTPRAQAEKRQAEMLAAMMTAGVDPYDLFND